MGKAALFSSILVAASASSALGEETWRLRMIDGTGLGNANNAGVGRMVAHEHYLYLASWNTQEGTIVYRSKDGESWEPISEPGIGAGAAADFTLAGFVWYGDHLYAGTWNQRHGAAMYRANADAPDANDIVWETVTTEGFGNRRNWGFTHLRPFNGHLYVSCFNFLEGSEVWRSDSGDPGTWAMVCPKGWNATFNTDTTMMVVHDGYLYAGTESARDTEYVEGMQLWRTDGNLAPPYNQWEQVNDNGFGNPRNHNICGFAVLDGRIYAGTWNQTQGIEVWRAAPEKETPFTNWERVVQGGNGDQDNIYTTCMVTLDDTLFLSTIGTFESEPALYFLPNVKTKSAHGGRLLKTTDGTRWDDVDAESFADSPYIGIQWLATFKGKLYIGMQSFELPAQLWVYEPVE